jgi:hypothetical protein
MKLDAKFYGEIFKVKDDTRVADDEFMVFLAKDNAFALTLPIYLHICIALGCDQEHVDSVRRTMARLVRWRADNPKRLKNPDAKGEKLLA